MATEKIWQSWECTACRSHCVIKINEKESGRLIPHICPFQSDKGEQRFKRTN